MPQVQLTTHLSQVEDGSTLQLSRIQAAQCHTGQVQISKTLGRFQTRRTLWRSDWLFHL